MPPGISPTFLYTLLLLWCVASKARAAAKNWQKCRGSCSQCEKDCKIVIRILDLLEKTRPLSHSESALRIIIVNILTLTTEEKLTHWRQWSKIWMAIEGDENTKFLHACATHRNRSNKIQLRT